MSPSLQKNYKKTPKLWNNSVFFFNSFLHHHVDILHNCCVHQIAEFTSFIGSHFYGSMPKNILEEILFEKQTILIREHLT